jgi:hypothetical protein
MRAFPCQRELFSFVSQLFSQTLEFREESEIMALEAPSSDSGHFPSLNPSNMEQLRRKGDAPEMITISQGSGEG